MAFAPVVGPLGRVATGGRNWEGFGADRKPISFHAISPASPWLISCSVSCGSARRKHRRRYAGVYHCKCKIPASQPNLLLLNMIRPWRVLCKAAQRPKRMSSMFQKTGTSGIDWPADQWYRSSTLLETNRNPGEVQPARRYHIPQTSMTRLLMRSICGLFRM